MIFVNFLPIIQNILFHDFLKFIENSRSFISDISPINIVGIRLQYLNSFADTEEFLQNNSKCKKADSKIESVTPCGIVRQPLHYRSSKNEN